MRRARSPDAQLALSFYIALRDGHAIRAYACAQLPCKPRQGAPLPQLAIASAIRSGPSARRAAALGAAGVLAALVTLVSGCGVSSASGVVLDAGASCASVYPNPGTQTAGTKTQISIRGVRGASLSRAHIRIAGSTSGTQSGRWVVDSDGDGASFYATRPFAAGETVTVTLGAPICGARGTHASFTIAHPPAPNRPA